MKKRQLIVMSALLLACGHTGSYAQNPWNGKVILEGYWWDYWNSNYPNGWANYLADLAPRLSAIGIDKVWMPPCIKNASPGSVGYSPFDYYDLGDKYQKGNLKTRLGTKDELLRSVAVLHANGIDVIEDAVLGHTSDAGSATGAGGQDPNTAYSMQTNSGYKNFRYVCYKQPAGNESSADYLSRQGRWPMNYENFFPNQYNNHYNTNDWDQILFGATIDYDGTAYGGSSNATYNPSQSTDYMRTQARNWLIWFKQQTGCDGIRFDAAKNYPYWALQDFLYNVKYNAGFANGGSNMFAVGEYVGSASDMDTWINNVKYSNGGSEDMVGTFDFNLRSALKSMVGASGSYDLSTIPAAQQSNRYRTVPFVNNHDTFRPTVDSTGNYTGWDSGNEMAGGHIDPFDVRLSAAYAIAFAVDGSPQVFFEDLFNIGGTGKRYSHLPTNATDLPMRDDIVNIIWCHQKLNFKKGAYKVRYSAPDLLIIERGYNAGPENSYAIIGVNDNYSTWQSATVQTDFGPNKQLHDYSGANSSDIWTDANGKATIYVPPCNGSNVRKGYCIWGPAGVTGGFSPTQNSTTQQWEMSDDLGDSHASSLGQGGAIPASSTAWRTVGKVFDQNGKTITVNVYPVNTTPSLTASLYNSSGTQVATTSGAGTLTITYTPTATGFYTVKVKNTSASNPGQTVYVKVNYTAPLTANTASYPARKLNPETAEQAAADLSLQCYPNPANDFAWISYSVPQNGDVTVTLYDMKGVAVNAIEEHGVTAGKHQVKLNTEAVPAGIYIVKVNAGNMVQTARLSLVK
ncbi:alpha-amylase domain-containing protein [Chitinophagaceae bacterium MMS25-I14]